VAGSNRPVEQRGTRASTRRGAASTSYGTPALKARGKLLVRLREDGQTLVLMTTFIDRDLLLRDKPKTFFTEEHYRNYPAILTRLTRVGPNQLRDMIEAAWRRVTRS
jgi:hypothetical protein